MYRRSPFRQRPLGAAAWVLMLAPVAIASADVPAPETAAQSTEQVVGTATRLVVRARARGAMLVTTDMGAKVTLRDTATGALLAQGLTLGTVGGADPELSAAFRTTLHLTKATRVEATVEAPLSYPHAGVSATATAWLLPGKHVEGEGWTLELPGFVVTLLDPPTTVARAADEGIDLTAKVVMMCGCPTEPGGRWDASTYELTASLLQSDRVVATMPLTYADEKSTYRARLDVPPTAGYYQVQVTAYDPATGNVGVAEAALAVR
ncbi:MAG: hypothetical protein AAFX85_08440 [Pseudomonadota bacterium]